MREYCGAVTLAGRAVLEIRERQRVGAQLRVEQDHSPRRQLVRESLASIWSSVRYMSVKPSSRTCASELWLQRSTAVSRPTGGNGERTAGTSVTRRTRSLRQTTRLARNGRETSVGPGEGAGVADGAPEPVEGRTPSSRTRPSFLRLVLPPPGGGL